MTTKGEEILSSIISKYKFQPFQNPITVRLDFEKGELTKKRIKTLKKVFSKYYYKEGFNIKRISPPDLGKKWDYKNEHLWMTLKPSN